MAQQSDFKRIGKFLHKKNSHFPAFLKTFQLHLQLVHSSDNSLLGKLFLQKHLVNKVLSLIDSLSKISEAEYKERHQSQERINDAHLCMTTVTTLKSYERQSTIHSATTQKYTELKGLNAFQQSELADLAAEMISESPRKNIKTIVRQATKAYNSSHKKLHALEKKRIAADSFKKKTHDAYEYFLELKNLIKTDIRARKAIEHDINTQAWTLQLAASLAAENNKLWRLDVFVPKIKQKADGKGYYSINYISQSGRTQVKAVSAKKSNLTNEYAQLAHQLLIHFNERFEQSPLLKASLTRSLTQDTAEKILQLSLENFKTYQNWDAKVKAEATEVWEEIHQSLRLAIENNENQLQVGFYINLGNEEHPMWRPVAMNKLLAMNLTSLADIEKAIEEGVFSNLSLKQKLALTDTQQRIADMKMKNAELRAEKKKKEKEQKKEK